MPENAYLAPALALSFAGYVLTLWFMSRRAKRKLSPRRHRSTANRFPADYAGVSLGNRPPRNPRGLQWLDDPQVAGPLSRIHLARIGGCRELAGRTCGTADRWTCGMTGELPERDDLVTREWSICKRRRSRFPRGTDVPRSPYIMRPYDRSLLPLFRLPRDARRRGSVLRELRHGDAVASVRGVAVDDHHHASLRVPGLRRLDELRRERAAAAVSVLRIGTTRIEGRRQNAQAARVVKFDTAAGRSPRANCGRSWAVPSGGPAI